jgi:hypothetical protein
MNKFEVGHKVTMIDEVFEGVVIGVSQFFVTVRNSDDFDFKIEKKKLMLVDTSQLMLEACKQEIIFKDEILDHQIKKKNLHLKPDKKGVIEVDLHIEKLISNFGNRTNHEILTLQVRHAEQVIELCLRKRYSRIVFIHGVGDGVLKSQLYMLFRKYPLKFYDTDVRKYGIGATEVLISMENMKSKHK